MRNDLVTMMNTRTKSTTVQLWHRWLSVDLVLSRRPRSRSHPFPIPVRVSMRFIIGYYCCLYHLLSRIDKNKIFWQVKCENVFWQIICKNVTFNTGKTLILSWCTWASIPVNMADGRVKRKYKLFYEVRMARQFQGITNDRRNKWYTCITNYIMKTTTSNQVSNTVIIVSNNADSSRSISHPYK